MQFNPYPGLRPFEFEESDLFYGREGQAEEVLRRLQKSRFVAVVGTSGSGKSSLVRAGLLPLLYGGLMVNTGSLWRMAILRPGNNPIHNLARALVYPPEFAADPFAENDNPLELSHEMKVEVVETILRRSAVGLLDYVQGGSFESDENLLIVVDQFEELFRYKQRGVAGDTLEAQTSEAEDKTAFVKLLLEAVHSQTLCNVYVVITMRSDYLGDCAEFRDLPETINDGQYLIPRMTRDQMREAIEEPIKTFGKQVKMSEPLVNRLLNDIGGNQDQLPILQHALMRTWNRWKTEGMPPEITVEHYEDVGGMAKALSLHADEAYNELDADSQLIAEKMFRCLTNVDEGNRETRRETELGEICRIIDADISKVIPVIEAFRREGRTFLMPPPDVPLDAACVIDISHESLIRNWDKLTEWVADEAKWARFYRRLADDALLHLAGETGYWSDPALQIALDWRENLKPNAAWAERYHPAFAQAMKFLDDSATERERLIAMVQEQQERELRFAQESAAAKEREAAILSKSARRLRWMVAALTVMLLISSALTIVSFYYYQKALASESDAKLFSNRLIEAVDELKESERNLKETNLALIESEKGLKETNEALTKSEGELKESLAKVEKSEREQKREAERANAASALAQQKADEAKKASAIAAQKADEANSAKEELVKTNKKLSDNYKELEIAIEKQRIEATKSEESAKREGANRRGLIALEKEENKTALEKFNELLGKYDSQNLTPAQKAEGKWWAHYNLGLIKWKMKDYDVAQASFRDAITTLDTFQKTLVFNAVPRSVSFLKVADKSEDEIFGAEEIKTSRIITLRNQARLYRDWGESSKPGAIFDCYEGSDNLCGGWAADKYEELLRILAEHLKTGNFSKASGISDPRYSAAIEAETAKLYFELYKLDLSAEHYRKAIFLYESFCREENIAANIAARKGLMEAEMRREKFDLAEAEAREILRIREQELKKTFDDPEIADSYEDISEIYSKHAEFLESQSKKGANSPDRAEKPRELTDEEKARIEQLQIQSATYSKISTHLLRFNKVTTSEESLLNEGALADDFFESESSLITSFLNIGRCDIAKSVLPALKERLESHQNKTAHPVLFAGRLFEIAERYRTELSDEASAEKIYLEIKNIFAGDAAVGAKDVANIITANLRRTGDYFFERKKYDLAKEFYNLSLKISNFDAGNASLNELGIYVLTYLDLNLVAIADGANPAEIQNNYAQMLEILKTKSISTPEGLPTAEAINNRRAVLTAYIQIHLADFYLEQSRKNPAQKDKRNEAQALYENADKVFDNPAIESTLINLGFVNEHIRSLERIGDIQSSQEERDFNKAAQAYQKALDKMRYYYPKLAKSPRGLLVNPNFITSFKASHLRLLESLIRVKGASAGDALKQERDKAELDYKAAQDKIKEEEEKSKNAEKEVKKAECKPPAQRPAGFPKSVCPSLENQPSGTE